MSVVAENGPEADTSEAAASRRRRLKRVAQGALVTGIVIFLVLSLWRSWQSVAGYEWALHPGWLALSAAAFLAFYGAQALGWWFILRGFALRASLTAMTATWAKSILARYVPGTVFMFVGRAWMCHAQGLPIDRVSAAMAYEQVLGVSSALVALIVLLPFWQGQPASSALVLLGLPPLLVVLHPRVFRPLADRLLRLLRREPLTVVLPYRQVMGLLLYYSTTWAFAGVGAWLLGRATVGLAFEALPAVTAAYALAYVAGMVAFILPSGIGVREAVLTASLSAWLPSGVALAWALLLRLWVTLVELAFVGAAVIAARLRDRRRAK